MEKINLDYAELKERYIQERELRKKFDKEATTYYYQNAEYRKKIVELKEEIKIKEKKIKDLELINLALYEKIYNKGVDKK